jgi:hypothetical protein
LKFDIQAQIHARDKKIFKTTHIRKHLKFSKNLKNVDVYLNIQAVLMEFLRDQDSTLWNVFKNISQCKSKESSGSAPMIFLK